MEHIFYIIAYSQKNVKRATGKRLKKEKKNRLRAMETPYSEYGKNGKFPFIEQEFLPSGFVKSNNGNQRTSKRNEE